MVLVPRQVGQVEEGLGRDDHLADPAGSVVAMGLAIEQAQALVGLAVLTCEAPAEHLEAGADGQDGCATLDRVDQSRSGPQLAGGERLGGVLAAAHDVDLAAAGDGLAGVDVDHLGGDVAPSQSLGQDGGVPTVAVGAEQLGIEQADGDGISHPVPPR